MILHAFQSMVLYTLLYGLYKLFLKKETFFQFNRFYLLSIPMIALLLPFVQLPIKAQLEQLLGIKSSTVTPLPLDLTTIDTTTTVEINNAVTAVTTQETWDLPLLIYGIGAAIALMLFFYKLVLLRGMIHKSRVAYKDKYRIMHCDDVQGGFSFLNMIFIGNKQSPDVSTVIINHELIHVRQRHSWDLIVHELVRVVFWFNPLLLAAHNDLQITHEFIVDKELAQQNKQQYTTQLLQSIMQCPAHALTNSFYKSSFIKNRIIMIQKNQSPLKKLLSLAAIIPIVALMIGFNAVAQTTETSSTPINEVKVIKEVQQKRVSDSSFTYPKLSEFEYGKVDFYESLTKNEIEQVLKFMDYQKSPKEKRSMTYKNEEITKSMRSLEIIRANGKTIVQKNDGLLLIVSEMPNEEPKIIPFPYYLKKGVSNTDMRIVERNISLNKKYDNVIETKSEVQVKNDNGVLYDVPFAVIHKVPRFEDCTGTKDEIKKCVSQKITNLVNENFNTSVISKENKGRHSIAVQFKIDKDGDVVNIQSRAAFPELQAEAERVVKLIPKMIPGEIENGSKVGVIYGLPIIFKID